VPASGLHHVRVRREHTVDDTAQVDVENVIPMRAAQLVCPPAQGHARAADEDVDLPAGRDDVVDSADERAPIGHVEDGRRSAELRGGGLESDGISIGEHHVGAEPSELPPEREADPRRAAGHHRDRTAQRRVHQHTVY
jgi:hypothetical protein